MKKSTSFKSKFLYFTVISFGAILGVLLLVVSFMLNSSFNTQAEKQIASSLEVYSHKINDKLNSISLGLNDHAKKSVLINPLMQFDRNSLALRDYLSELSILGYKGSFSILGFDQEALIGSIKFDESDFTAIIDGERDYIINLLSNNNEFQFLVPIKFSGTIEGVLIFKTLIPKQHFAYASNTNIVISNKNFSMTIEDLDKKIKNLKSRQKDLVSNFKIEIFFDPYTYIKNKVYTIAMIFVFLSLLISIFALYFYHKGKTNFINPHEELLKVKTELDNSVSFKDSLINSSAHIIISTDGSGIIQSFNSAGEENFGYKAKELINQSSICELYDVKEIETKKLKLNAQMRSVIKNDFDVFNHEIKKGKDASDTQWLCIRKDRTEFQGRLILTAIKNKHGLIQGYLGIIEDITQLNIAKEMEKVVKKELEHTARAKSEFLANMSHEIRTPMNGVLGMVQLLSETDLDPSQSEMLNTIHTCGDSLLTILNDILDFSKIESGKMSLEKINFNIHKCIDNALYLTSHNAYLKGVTVKFIKNESSQHWFKGDVTRITQILVNYLSNAIKFTENGEVTIELEVKSVIEDLAKITISVRDTGIGISEDALKKLFNAFTQADTSTTRKFGGTGLGLSICAKLAQLMEGEVFATSVLGTGSTFGVNLPLKCGEEEVITEELVDDFKEGSLLSSNFPHRILLVEDNQVNQKLVKMMLKKIGYTCDIANNGLEAVQAVQQLKKSKNLVYTIIFMDMQMPEMDGLEATTVLLEKYKSITPPIVAMTANAFAEDKEKCFSVGMSDFISKPISRGDISRVLKKTYNLKSSSL